MRSILAGLVILLASLKTAYPQYGDNIRENIDTSGFESVSTQDLEKTMGLAQAYLEIGYRYQEQKNFQKASEYFEKSRQEAQGETSQVAQLALIHLRSLNGNKDVLNDIVSLGADRQAEGYYLMADGWESYYLDDPDQEDYLDLAKEYYSFLSLHYPNSTWGGKAKLKLATLHIQDKRYDLALEYLLPILEQAAKKTRKKGEEGHDLPQKIQEDLAWYLMGQVLERSQRYRDYAWAVRAYNKVVGHRNSPFRRVAQSRIEYIKKLPD